MENKLTLYPLGYEIKGIFPSRLHYDPQILREREGDRQWIIVIPPRVGFLSAFVVDPAGELIDYELAPDEKYMRFETAEKALAYLEQNWKRLRGIELEQEFDSMERQDEIWSQPEGEGG